MSAPSETRRSKTPSEPPSAWRLWGATLPVLAVLAASVPIAAHLGVVHALVALLITVTLTLVIGVFVGLPAENTRLLRDMAVRLIDLLRQTRP